MMWSNEISCKCDVPKITRARICVKLWRSWKQTRWSPADVTNPVTFGGLLEYQYVYIYIYVYTHTCEIGKQFCASIFFSSWSFRFVAGCQPFSDVARSWQYIVCATVTGWLQAAWPCFAKLRSSFVPSGGHCPRSSWKALICWWCGFSRQGDLGDLGDLG